METVPAASRARKFAWLRSEGVPERWIVALQQMFPAPSPERPLASLSQQAANLGAAIMRNTKSVARGQAFKIEPAEQARREGICQACPSDFYRAVDRRCAHPKCNCFLRFKTWLKAERCPAEHW